MKVVHLIHESAPKEELVFERGLFDSYYKMRLVIDGKTAYTERTPYRRETVAKGIKSGRKVNGLDTVTICR